VVDENAREVLRVLLETADPLRMLPDLVAQDTDPVFFALVIRATETPFAAPQGRRHER
jgi:hypothetical protein